MQVDVLGVQVFQLRIVVGFATVKEAFRRRGLFEQQRVVGVDEQFAVRAFDETVERGFGFHDAVERFKTGQMRRADIGDQTERGHANAA